MAEQTVKEGHLYTNAAGTKVVHAFDVWKGDGEVFIDFCVIPGSKLECVTDNVFLNHYPRIVDHIIIVEDD